MFLCSLHTLASFVYVLAGGTFLPSQLSGWAPCVMSQQYPSFAYLDLMCLIVLRGFLVIEMWENKQMKKRMLINSRKDKSIQERKWNHALPSPAVDSIYNIKIERKKDHPFL